MRTDMLNPDRWPSAGEIIGILTGFFTGTHSNGYGPKNLTVGEHKSFSDLTQEIS
jgi:hypothetical protein